jgi:hypothetical protein
MRKVLKKSVFEKNVVIKNGRDLEVDSCDALITGERITPSLAVLYFYFKDSILLPRSHLITMLIAQKSWSISGCINKA